MGILRRRLLLALGSLSFLAGLAILSLGLSVYFSGGSSAPQVTAPDARVAEALREFYTPRFSEAVPTPTPVPTEEPPPPPPVTRDVPYRMIIEQIGVEAPVVEMGLDEQGVPEVPLNGYDVAWYNFSAVPGTGSNAVFAGHVNWARAPGSFARLKDLKPGDVVRLVARDGRELEYVVTENFMVDPFDPDSLRVMAPTPMDMITLITCGGTWIPDPNERFGGNYTNRVIVRATLVQPTAAEVTEASGGS